MTFLENVIVKASSDKKTIVLPEGNDSRIIEASKIILDKNIANLVILGNETQIQADLKSAGIDVSKVKVIDPKTSTKAESYARLFYDIRKHKGMTLEQAREIVKDEMYFSTLMVKADDAQGLVAGASHSTGNTIRPALQIIKPKEGVKTISSVFFMCFPNDQVYIFADCAIVEKPNPTQLSDIAIVTAATSIQFGFTPRIAMLSYSTKGSAKGDDAYKVARATERAKEKIAALFGYGSSVMIDGELQFDSAFVPSIAEKKCPDSEIKGTANVFIFPDLDAGNICYKAVQRLAGCEALGPVLQGLAKPVNDLSRGCSTEDVVGMVALTAVQAQL